MRKLTILGLSLMLILGITACDLNIFSSFDTPIFSSEQFEEAMGDMDGDGDGEVDSDKVMESSTTVNVSASAKDYVETARQMVDSSSGDNEEDGLSDDEKELVAKNLETIVTSVIGSLGIDLDQEDTEEKSFEDYVKEKKADASTEEIEELRAVIQTAATTAVAVRLQTDPDAKSLEDNSLNLILSFLDEEEESDTTKSLSSDEAVSDYQIVFVDKDGSKFYLDVETDPVDNEQYTVITENEPIDTAEANDQVTDLLIVLEEMKGAGAISTDQRVQLLDIILTGSNSGMVSALGETFNFAKISNIAGTFDSISSNSRAFVSTINYDDKNAPSDGINLGSLSPKFRETYSNGYQLSADGEDMVFRSLISIIFDYLFDVDGDNEPDNGILDSQILNDFINEGDAISFDDADSVIEVEIRYLADLLPLYDTSDSDDPQTLDSGELLMRMVEDDFNPDADTPIKDYFGKDLTHLDKLIRLSQFSDMIFSDEYAEMTLYEILDSEFGGE
jgi:hypothetical protein